MISVEEWWMGCNGLPLRETNRPVVLQAVCLGGAVGMVPGGQILMRGVQHHADAKCYHPGWVSLVWNEGCWGSAAPTASTRAGALHAGTQERQVGFRIHHTHVLQSARFLWKNGDLSEEQSRLVTGKAFLLFLMPDHLDMTLLAFDVVDISKW